MDTLFHINWGDGDNAYTIAPDEATARDRMPDGKDMVNYMVRLDHLYNLIFKAGMKEVVDWIHKEFGGYIPDFKGGLVLKNILIDEEYGETGSMDKWQAFLKENGLEG